MLNLYWNNWNAVSKYLKIAINKVLKVCHDACQLPLNWNICGMFCFLRSNQIKIKKIKIMQITERIFKFLKSERFFVENKSHVKLLWFCWSWLDFTLSPTRHVTKSYQSRHELRHRHALCLNKCNYWSPIKTLSIWN